VRVDRIAFAPQTLRVKPRTRVTWRFREPYVTHNVSSRGRPRFASSGDQREGTEYAVTFRRRGTYRYVCSLHPGMTGKVVVVVPAR
jgi:plastocyanin